VRRTVKVGLKFSVLSPDISRRSGIQSRWEGMWPFTLSLFWNIWPLRCWNWLATPPVTARIPDSAGGQE
jgi:hypothetical protein